MDNISAQNAPRTASASPPVSDTAKPKEAAQRPSEGADGDVPRRRGRPKGLGKVPGSGRKKGSANWTSERRREFFVERGLLETLADIIEGKEMTTTGPTGKSIKVRSSLDLRAKTAVGVYNKCWPDETVSDITSRDESDTPKHSVRHQARAVLALFREAVVPGHDEDMPTQDEIIDSPSTATTNSGPLAPKTVRFADPDLATRVFPGEGDDLAAAMVNGKDKADEPTEPGERELIGESGACIVCERIEPGADGREMWAVVSGVGHKHEALWGRASARKRAEELLGAGKL